MKRIVYPISLWFLLVFGSSGLAAQSLMLAAGAGYKKPVTEVVNAFRKTTDAKMTEIYGNIRMVTTQARQTGEVDCIIGDRKFLNRVSSQLNNFGFSRMQAIGQGYLVLAWRKGVHPKNLDDLLRNKSHQVFMPQQTRAVYGIAAQEFIKSGGYQKCLAGKLTQVATVPQVAAYLLTGEADSGFINLTEALADGDRLGGYFLIPQEEYGKIEIVAGLVSGKNNGKAANDFMQFLDTDEARAILKKYGLQ